MNMATSELIASASGGYFHVLSLRGVRTQTQLDPINGALLSTQVALISSLIPVGAYCATELDSELYYAFLDYAADVTTNFVNNNTIQLQFPQLSTTGGGLA